MCSGHQKGVIDLGHLVGIPGVDRPSVWTGELSATTTVGAHSQVHAPLFRARYVGNGL